MKQQSVFYGLVSHFFNSKNFIKKQFKNVMMTANFSNNIIVIKIKNAAKNKTNVR